MENTDWTGPEYLANMAAEDLHKAFGWQAHGTATGQVAVTLSPQDAYRVLRALAEGN